MKVSRSILRKHAYRCAEYIVLHALWRKKRGKGGPILSFIGERNPEIALSLASHYAYFPLSGVYLSGKIPKDYTCSDCNVHGVKLWRGANIFNSPLKCADCAAAHQNKDISSINEAGIRTTTSLGNYNYETNQIGSYVPAVPTECNDAYWSNSFIPNPGRLWWIKLPLRLT